MTLLVTTPYVLAAALLGAYALFELRLLARFLRHRTRILESARSRPTGSSAQVEGPPPRVTIQIPLYNERTAAEQVILATAAQDYPLDRFDIQVLDDSTDETTGIVARLVERLQAKGVSIRHITRANREGYKAGALAAGLKRSTAEFVAIFDADFSPDSRFLRQILIEDSPFADPTVAFVQARWDWNEFEGLFQASLSLLLDRHFLVQKPTKAFMGNVTTFNGSGGIWRRAAIDAAGGWSADTLTEDLDLSYRSALRGWHGRYLRDVAVRNDLPTDMRALKLQQHRWSRGNAQCLRKLTLEVFRSGGVIRERWEEAHLLAGYAFHPLLVVLLVLWPWAVMMTNRPLFVGLQVFLSFCTVVAPLSFLLALRERGDPVSWRSAIRVAGGLALGLGLMVANTVGQVQGFFSKEGEFARTPKSPRRNAPATSSADRAYTSPLHWTFFLELVVIAYCFASFVYLARAGEIIWAPPLLFWGGCLSLVVALQLLAGGKPGTREPYPTGVPVLPN